MTANETRITVKDTEEICRIDDCLEVAKYHCSICYRPLCEEHTEPDLVPMTPINYCPEHYEAWKKSLADGKVGEAGAVFALMGWLTSRDEVSGPFSARHEASQAAELVAKFCKMQGWEITDNYWHRHIKPYREETPSQAQQAMTAAGLPPGVPGAPVLPGQVYPPPAPIPGQPAGAQPGQAPPQGGKL